MGVSSERRKSLSNEAARFVESGYAARFIGCPVSFSQEECSLTQ